MYTWDSSDHGRGTVVGRQEWRRGRSKETPGKREPPHARGGRQEIRKSGGRSPLVVVRITLLRLGRGNCAIATLTHVVTVSSGLLLAGERV